MFETIIGFLLSNCVSIAIIVGFAIVSVYLWQIGYEKNVSLYLLALIAKAELQFQHGENKEKLESVLFEIYEAFPVMLKFFYSKNDMIVIIETMVEETKEWLQEKSK